MPDGPRDDRLFVSREMNRWFYPFNRASAEAGRAARRRSDANGQNFSGRAVSNPIATDWAKKGVWGLPSALLPTFPAKEK